MILKRTPVAALGTMLGVAAIIVSTSVVGSGATLPAGTWTATDAASGEVSPAAQSLRVHGAPAEAGSIRDSYTAREYVAPVTELPGFKQQAARSASGSFNYSNNPAGSIQWPLVHPSPITYGFGPRNACSYCSTYHLGVDFTPGAGTPVQSIADGVVSAVSGSGPFGNHVVVDHVIAGQRIQSLYAHMKDGTVQVTAGQQVKVGTILGAVGSTGSSTGAHLHLEIHADGTPVDPFRWLKANAN